MYVSEPVLSSQLTRRDESAFEQVFKSHFKNLHSYACTILRDEVVAEDVVQNVFVKLWNNLEQANIHLSITAYLYRAVHNESLNIIKHEKIKTEHRQFTLHSMKNQTDNAARKVLQSELEKRLHEAMNELPEQCRTIFQMSRFDELKYHEIASRLGISIKTVENQMGKALKLLRIKLVDFLPLLALLLPYLN